MSNPTDTDIGRLRELLAKATPRPWNTNTVDEDGECVRKGVTHVATCDFGFQDPVNIPQIDKDNAALIVAAVNALPALLAKAEALEEAEKALREILDMSGPTTAGRARAVARAFLARQQEQR